jgi:hypothetical protein
LPGTVRIRDAAPITTAEQGVKLESAHGHLEFAGLWESADPGEPVRTGTFPKVSRECYTLHNAA